MYQIGELIERWGSVYKVENVYDLTDEYMEVNELSHKTRITIRKVSGENGLDVLDFALVN